MTRLASVFDGYDKLPDTFVNVRGNIIVVLSLALRRRIRLDAAERQHSQATADSPW